MIIHPRDDIINTMIDNYKEGYPIIVGLAGKAGSGKTSVAEEIVPKGSLSTVKYGLAWDHIFYALPLYELATIKRSIRGHNEDSRRLYAIHDVAFDIFGKSAIGNIPNYEKLVDIVKEVNSMAIEPEGIKPRTFLQKAGDIFRSHNSDCFAQWAVLKSYSLYKDYKKSLDEELPELPFVILVSDVRFKNEAEHILKQPNGIVISFDASEETLDQRILKRDGKLMTSEQKSHRSEQESNLVKEISTFIINTDGLDVKQQMKLTLETLSSIIPGIKIEQGANA